MEIINPMQRFGQTNELWPMEKHEILSHENTECASSVFVTLQSVRDMAKIQARISKETNKADNGV